LAYFVVLSASVGLPKRKFLSVPPRFTKSLGACPKNECGKASQ